MTTIPLCFFFVNIKLIIFAIDCDNVEIHKGRILTYPVMTTVNASLTFSCNEGFALSGADTITCEHSGKWSSSPPECTKKCMNISLFEFFRINSVNYKGIKFLCVEKKSFVFIVLIFKSI